MATSKCYYPRQSHRFLPLSTVQPPCRVEVTAASELELDEFDLFNPVAPTRSNSAESARSWKKRSADPSTVITPLSLPVNVPDWSKILREEHTGTYRRRNEEEDDIGGDDVAAGDWSTLPPHEFLRNRMASLSVHEGVGRTLKGRDLSRVRNAIFEITGFQD